MKKLVVLLAAVMMFAFSATAYAATFTDLEDKSVTVQDAVAKTVALGIIDGYTDGTFGADKNITRAEFAKIAVTAAGSAETATMLENTASSFKDVKAGAWYTGWVNAAESLGLVQGVGNGNFNPNATITNQEVVTVLMRMLGYNDNLPGNWPVNYVTQANKIDVLDNVAIVAAAPATRGDVVVMVSDTLDANLVTYDKDTDEFVKKQTTKGGIEDDDITLLEDAFDGAFKPVKLFEAVTEVKDTAKQQLNWMGYIVDADTRVSVNGGNLFDLDGHQGKVYFVEENDKLYARFIEVESYAVAVGGDKPAMDGKKLKADNKTYSVADGFDETQDITTTAKKNNKWKLFFNDDDQVYAVVSDQDAKDKAYIVESITSSAVKLIGSEGKASMDNDDDEVLIWNGEEFVGPSELKVGDAVVAITGSNDELYELATVKSGTLTTSTKDQYKINGVNYKYGTVKILDGEYEDADVDLEDIYGNTVQYLLNDDNTLSAVIIDEVTAGNKLYGVIVNANIDDGKSLTASDKQTLTIFTEEGATVEYALDEDEEDDILKVLGGQVENAHLGQLVEYKLNKNGEIEDLTYTKDGNLMWDFEADKAVAEIEVKNDTYLVGGTNLTLADNVAIFEVSEDEGDLEVNLVTRAALLAGGDFTPEEVVIDVKGGKHTIPADAKYFVNNNGAARAFAYTDADTSNYNYGIVEDMLFAIDDKDVLEGLYFVGDDNLYEVTNWNTTSADDDYVVIYTQSGNDITIEKAFDNEDARSTYTEVTGWTDGLITLAEKVTVEVVDGDVATKTTNRIMTDANTIVYVIDKDANVTVGSLDDIAKGEFVKVPVMDDDDYAEVVIVSNYK